MFRTTSIIVLLLLLVIIVGAGAGAFGSKMMPEDGRYRAHLVIELLNQDEQDWMGLRGDAEFFLKVQSTQSPKLLQLIPLNLDGQFGEKLVVDIDFPFDDVNEDTLVFELIDDDTLSREQREQIARMVSSGAALFYSLTEKHLLVQPSAWLWREKFDIESSVEEFSAEIAHVVVENYDEKSYDSYGSVEYRVSDVRVPKLRDANRLSIIDAAGESRAHLWVFFVKR